jgi:hypothetical protein
MAKKFGAHFFEMSAKNKIGVEAPFEFAARQGMNAIVAGTIPVVTTTPQQLP